MSDFLTAALSGFWPFIGAMFLISLVGKIFAMLVIGVVASLRGSPVSYSAVSTTNTTAAQMSPDEVVKIVRHAIDGGKLDAPISRVINRNNQRRT